MKVQIEGNFYLESDSMQFIIREYNGNTDKNGNDLYKTHGYFPTVAYALNHFVKIKVMESTAQTLLELQDDVRSIREDLESRFDMNVRIKRTEDVEQGA